MKKKIREFVLNNFLLKELFFFFGHRKANLRKIEKRIKKLDVEKWKKIEQIPNLVVSLTSYGERIKELKYTLYSLITQTIRPKSILVNISYEDKILITQELHFFENFGIIFNYCDNLKSYKKLIPILEEYSTQNIVTADDDIFYKSKWLEKLWKCHKKFSDEIICHLVYLISSNENKILPYTRWKHKEKIQDVSKKNFFLGGSGTLYPPNSLYKDVIKKELFTTLAPLADDIWFYFMAILNNTKIRQVKNPYNSLCYVNPYREYGIIKGQTLSQENVCENKNDVQFKNILNYYHILEENFVNFINGKEDLKFN